MVLIYKAQNALVSWRVHLPSLTLLYYSLYNSLLFDADDAAGRKICIRKGGKII